MKLEEIHNHWEKDSKIDATELTEESLKISNLHSKYMKMYTSERVSLLKLESELPKLRKDKYEFYTQGPSKEHLERGWSYPGGKILKSEASIYLESDDDIINLNLKIAYQREKLDLLTNIIKSLNNRNFQIKNAIDYLKWTNGSY